MSAKETLKEKASWLLDRLGYNQVRFGFITIDAVEKANERIDQFTEYEAAQIVHKLRE